MTGLSASAVQAFRFFVDTQEYELTGVTGSFANVNVGTPTPLLEKQPWWGTATSAQTFANAARDPASGYDGGTYYFAYASSGNVQTWIVAPTGTSQVTNLNKNSSFPWATATAVPEIDGPVLAQGSLILGALYLALLTYRRRNRQTGTVA